MSIWKGNQETSLEKQLNLQHNFERSHMLAGTNAMDHVCLTGAGIATVALREVNNVFAVRDGAAWNNESVLSTRNTQCDQSGPVAESFDNVFTCFLDSMRSRLPFYSLGHLVLQGNKICYIVFIFVFCILYFVFCILYFVFCIFTPADGKNVRANGMNVRTNNAPPMFLVCSLYTGPFHGTGSIR